MDTKKVWNDLLLSAQSMSTNSKSNLLCDIYDTIFSLFLSNVEVRFGQAPDYSTNNILNRAQLHKVHITLKLRQSYAIMREMQSNYDK